MERRAQSGSSAQGALEQKKAYPSVLPRPLPQQPAQTPRRSPANMAMVRWLISNNEGKSSLPH